MRKSAGPTNKIHPPRTTDKVSRSNKQIHPPRTTDNKPVSKRDLKIHTYIKIVRKLKELKL